MTQTPHHAAARYVGLTNEWESAVPTAGCAHAFAAVYPEANEETVTDFLCFSTANPSSIRNCLEVARTNARAVRTALTVEMWDAINGTTGSSCKRFGNGSDLARGVACVSCAGSRRARCASTARAYRPCCATMPTGSRASASIIERADNTARILDVKYHVLLPRN